MTRNCRCTLVSVSAGPVEAVGTSAIEHLDQDWAVPCDAKLFIPETCAGRNPAEFIVRLIACCPKRVGMTGLWCATCLDVQRALPKCNCNFCGREFIPASAAIREVQPLNRRPQ